jgi:iron complex outermembrane recepter protein
MHYFCTYKWVTHHALTFKHNKWLSPAREGTKMNDFRRLLIALAVGTSMSASIQALAQPSQASDSGQGEASGDAGQVEEIVVTAQKRAQNLQEVPLAVTAFSEKALESRGLTNITALATVTPSLILGGGTSGVVTPFLRGVGSSATAVGNESSVAVYMDGVYFTRLPTGFFSLNNIDRVEVLKGPQGTLFGRNSSGGVIQIVTKDPSYTPELKARISYGNYDTIETSAYVSGGLTDMIAVGLSANYRKQNDGYGENIISGNRTSYLDYATLRGKLLFQPSEKTDITLTGYYGYSKGSTHGNTYPGTIQGYISAPSVALPTLPDYYDQRSDVDGYFRTEGWGTSVTVKQDIGFADLTSITAYSKSREKSLVDADSTDRPDFLVPYSNYSKQITQELQLASKGGGSFDWIVGAFYYNTLAGYDKIMFLSPSNQVSLGFGPGLDAPSRQRARSLAFYGQVTYSLLPRLNVTGGLRYTKDKTRADGYVELLTSPRVIAVDPPAASDVVNKVTFKAAVDYELTNDALLYASFSRGYKSAGFNLFTYNPVPNKPEILDAYEVGFKSDLFDRRVRVNGAVYQYNIKNPQVQLFTAGSIVLSNAGSARVRGAEIEVQAAVTSGLTARANASYLDSKYKVYGTLDANGNVINGAPSAPQNPNPPYGAIDPLISVIAGGNRTPQAPKWTLNLGLTYAFDTSAGNFQFNLDYYYNDGFFWEPDNLLSQSSYNLLNGRIRYQPLENFGVELWGKNLTDAQYARSGQTLAGPGCCAFVAGEPRTYGVSFDYRF